MNKKLFVLVSVAVLIIVFLISCNSKSNTTTNPTSQVSPTTTAQTSPTLLVTETITMTITATPSTTNTVNYINKFSCNDGYSAFLKNDGKLYTTGGNTYGQLGTGDTNPRNTFTFVLSDVIDVAAGRSHILAVKSNGQLYGAGANYTDYPLGLNLGAYSQFTQLSVTNVKCVAAGFNFSLAVTNNGELWVCGRNLYGQLGIGHNNNISAFTKITTMSGVKKVCAGNTHSLVITDDNKLWVAGKNDYGQLGIGNTINANTFTYVLDNVATFAAGSNHSLIVKNDGSLWVCGSNYYGSLGPVSSSYSYVQITTIANAIDVATSDYGSLVLTNDGSLYTSGQFFNSGNKFVKDSLYPISCIGAGTRAINFGLALKTDNTIWGYGDNISGQLGTGDNNNKLAWTQSSIQ